MSQDSSYRRDFKAKVALKAILGKGTFKELADEHNIEEYDVKNWKRKTLHGLFPEETVEASEEESQSNLNKGMGKLIYELREVNKTQRWTAIAQIVLAIFTFILAYFTAKMASATKYLAELKSKAELEIEFVMEAPFETVTKMYEGIRFSVKDYLYNTDNVNFYMEAKNICTIGIEDEITISYKARIFNRENQPISDELQIEEVFKKLKLDPLKKQKLSPILIGKLLSDEDKLNLEKNKENIDKFVKIRIEGSGKTILKFPFGIINIRYYSHKIEIKEER